MDRENLQNTVLLAAGLVLLFVPALLVPAPVLWVAGYGAILVAVALAVEPWVWRFSLGIIRAPPSETRSYLVRQLRVTGHVVRAEGEGLLAAIGGEAVVGLRIEPIDGGSRIVYRATATTAGWLSLVRLPGIYRRVRAWGRDASATLVPPEGRLPAQPAADDPRVVLIDALSETHRLAGEAHDAERETYQNSQALVVLAGIVGWFILFLALNTLSSDHDVNRRIAVSAGWAFVVTLPTSALGSWIIRRFRRDRVMVLREWAGRLEDALRAEGGPQGRGVPEQSTLELLLQSQPEVPGWLDAARKASVSIDPMSWWAVFVMVYFGVELLFWEVPLAVPFSLLFAVLLGLVGIALLVGAAMYYRRWRRRRERMLARARAEWDRSYQRLRGEMEALLGRL